MDYQFIRNEDAQPMAIFSMGAETLGRWISDELGSDQVKIQALLQVIDTLQRKEMTEYQLQGVEYDIELNHDEIEVRAHELSLSAPEELPEGTELYDQESITGCGLEDFKQVLLSWQDFIQG
ncbi:MAG: hypothetical protein ACI965_000585 [Paraglaciecola sp.]|jgi:uncharacterized protein YacL (UPF0231 family)